MVRAIFTGIAFAAATVTATASFAQDTAIPQSDWQLFPITDGCSMVRMVGDDGSPAVQVMLGHNGASTIMFFMPGSKVEPGQFYTGVVTWDDRSFPVQLPSVGSAEMPGVGIQNDDDSLVDAVAVTESILLNVLAVTDAIEFPLPGAKEATANLRKCVAETKPK